MMMIIIIIMTMTMIVMAFSRVPRDRVDTGLCNFYPASLFSTKHRPSVLPAVPSSNSCYIVGDGIQPEVMFLNVCGFL